MPKNSRKSRQRVLDLESTEDTVISNLAANEDNSTQMDKLKVLQEMFANRIDEDLVHDVFQECAGNAEQTLESLLELCGSAQYLPSDTQFPSESLNAITEVPQTLSEPPINESTNPNTEYLTNSTIRDPNVEVLKLTPINVKPLQISPLNAVMPFANLFAPKVNQKFTTGNNVGVKSSHLPKQTANTLKDEIKQTIQKGDQKVLVLMRGLPGSGKTTLANQLVRSTIGIILSTDDFFVNNGTYYFDPYRLPDAHVSNQKRAKKYIEIGRTPIVIDNTNLEGWEMHPYVSLGHSNGYKIYFLEPDTPWSRNTRELSKRNTHGIPKEKLENMIQRFQSKLTVEDVLKSLIKDNNLLQKSKSEEKVVKTKVSTNPGKNLIFRSNSSSPSTATNSAGDYAESPHSSTSTQLEDLTSTSSPISTEPTSPVSENQIDMDLLLALNQRSPDSEDCSSINASDGESSCVSQEFGWERDEEFTYSQNNQISVEESCDDEKPSGSTAEEVINENDFEVNPKPQRERKPRNALNEKQAIKEENLEDIEFSEPWDEPNSETPDNDNPIASSSSAPNNNKRLFGLVGVRKHNWEIPPFPAEANKMAANTSEISIICFSRQTQTEMKDWALLELRQCNNDSNQGLETEDIGKEEFPIETKVDPKKNVAKVSLHKGTFTGDIPDHQTREQKLDYLRTKFPKAEVTHLNDILGACREEHTWAEKLLSELSDNQFELIAFDVGDLEELSTGAESQATSPEIDSESISNEDEEPLEPLVDQKNDSDGPEFVLTLDPLLAAQLQSHFGSVTDRSLTAEDFTITLSHGIARLLHHNWKKSLNQKPLIKSSSKPQSITNNNKKKQSKHKSNKVVLSESTPKSELQEIMDLELAKELSRKEYDNILASNAINSLCPTKQLMAKELLSTKLKRDQLYQRYPGVDQSFLDTIFESNEYCLGKTIDVLDNSLGLSDDFSKEMEALIAEEKYNSPLTASRSASPAKQTVRKVVDINSLLLEMSELMDKKGTLHDKARLAYQRKMFAVASYYGDEAIQIQSRIGRLSSEIVDSILSNSANSNQLDLHGLHIQEVNGILSEYLRRKSEELRKCVGKRKMFIDIITGYGATIGVQGRIKPNVIQYLKQKNLTYEMINMGVIRVTLCQCS